MTTCETLAGNELLEFYVDTTGAEGTFDTFGLVILSAGLFNQVGIPATPILQPSEDSGFSAFLEAPQAFGGQGLSAFGIVDTTSELRGTFASLGDNSASTQGNYLVAQVVKAPGGATVSYQASFFDDGQLIGFVAGFPPLTPPHPIGPCVPEPTSLAVLGIGCFVLATIRFLQF